MISGSRSGSLHTERRKIRRSVGDFDADGWKNLVQPKNGLGGPFFYNTSAHAGSLRNLHGNDSYYNDRNDSLNNNTFNWDKFGDIPLQVPIGSHADNNNKYHSTKSLILEEYNKKETNGDFQKLSNFKSINKAASSTPDVLEINWEGDPVRYIREGVKNISQTNSRKLNATHSGRYDDRIGRDIADRNDSRLSLNIDRIANYVAPNIGESFLLSPGTSSNFKVPFERDQSVFSSPARDSHVSINNSNNYADNLDSRSRVYRNGYEHDYVDNSGWHDNERGGRMAHAFDVDGSNLDRRRADNGPTSKDQWRSSNGVIGGYEFNARGGDEYKGLNGYNGHAAGQNIHDQMKSLANGQGFGYLNDGVSSGMSNYMTDNYRNRISVGRLTNGTTNGHRSGAAVQKSDASFMMDLQKDLETHKNKLSGEVERLLSEPMGGDRSEGGNPPVTHIDRRSIVPIFTTYVDLAEFKNNQVNVTVDKLQNKLVVEAVKANGSPVASSFSQKIQLPRFADDTAVKARMDRNGLLKIQVPLLFYFPESDLSATGGSRSKSKGTSSFVYEVKNNPDGSSVVEILVKAAPDVTLENLNVELKNTSLLVYVTKKVGNKTERTLIKSYHLPNAAQPDKIITKATNDGCLSILVPILPTRL